MKTTLAIGLMMVVGLAGAAQGALGNAVILSWSPNSTNEAITSYQVYQSPTVTNNFVKVATVAGTNATLTLPPSAYFFYVTASNAFWGEGSASSTVHSPPAPTPVTTLAMGKSGTSLIVLSWQANDPAQQIAAYNVYTSGSRTGPFTPVGSTPGTSLNVSVTPGAAYYYVTASNFWGETDPGNIVSTPSPPSMVQGVTIRRQ